jgi:hypothetical protein
MRKTHGKKQTRKNKTKRRAIRGGGKLSYSIAGHNQRNTKGYRGYRNAITEYFKKYNNPSENNNKEENESTLTPEQQQKLERRRSRRINKSTAQEPPQTHSESS